MPANACRRLANAGRVLALILLVGCGGYESDIGAVKKAQTLPGLSNDELVMDLAGGRSTVAWEAAPVEAEGSDEVIEVVAVINRAARSGMKHEVRLRFHHDRRDGSVSLRGVSLDGEIFDLLSIPLNVFKLQME